MRMGEIRIPVVPPPPRTPLAVTDVPVERGERVVIGNPEGHHYGYRLWTAPFTDPTNGRGRIEVVSEHDYWRHVFTGAAPDRVMLWPSLAAWVE